MWPPCFVLSHIGGSLPGLMSSTGAEPDLVFDSYRIAEVHRPKHGALVIFNVDAVMEHHAAFVFGPFSERDAHLSNGMCSRCSSGIGRFHRCSSSHNRRHFLCPQSVESRRHTKPEQASAQVG